MRVFYFVLLVLACFFERAIKTFAQTDSLDRQAYSADINDFKVNSVEEKVSITSQSPLFIRDAPETVSIISEEEIQSAGARDLKDVFRLIPGFDFYVDVQGVVGIGVRGNLANEGTLLLVDGLEMNELLFGSNQFGNHFPIDQIRRIEVIRGPGAIIYGGFGVHAVINILTKATEWYNGFRMGQTVGETENGMARRNFSASIGRIGKKVRYSITASLAEANRSDRNYTDLNGQSYNMLGNSALSNKFLSFNFKYGNLFIKGLADYYLTQSRDNQTAISSKAYPLDFKSLHFETRYEWKVKSNLNIQPFINFRNQLPWMTLPNIDSVDLDKVIAFKVRARRLQTGIRTLWTPIKNLEFLLMANTYVDQAKDYLNPDSSSQTATFYCTSLLGQAIWKSKIANFTVGIRFDDHSYYRPILTPRIAVTKSIKNWYGKASYNRSFRTPAMSNIALSIEQKIQPQITDCYEVEIGTTMFEDLNLSVNLYRTNIRNGIVYSLLNDGFTEGYSNAVKMGTKGIETQARYAVGKLTLQSAYSFYTTKDLPTYQAFEVPGKNLNLAFPAHKFNIMAKMQITKKVKISNTIIVVSDRFGYNGNSENPGYINYGKVFQWNIFVQAKDVYLKGLSIGAGVFDILNSNYSFIQAYNSGHNPLPEMSREFVIKLIYGLNLSN